jgi:hypothetical protein
MTSQILRGCALAFAAAALLAGCADIEVEPLRTDGAAAPLAGKFTYFLPRTALDITVGVTVTQCGSLSTLDDTGAPDGGVRVKTSITAVPVLEADPAAGYVIDYDAARSWMKEINFTVGTTSGKVFQSFNGTINDQSGPIALAALTAAVQIAGAAAIPGVGSVAAASHFSVSGRFPLATAIPLAPPHDDKDYCTTDVQKALATVIADQATVKRLKKKIEDTLEKSSGSKQDDSDVSRWSQAVVALQSEIADKTAKALQKSVQKKWTPSPSDFSQNKTDLPWYATYQVPINTLLAPMLSDSGKAWYADVTNNGPDDKGAAFYKAHVPATIIVALDPHFYFDETASGTDKFLKAPKIKGLLVRDPAIGFMQKCTAGDDRPKLKLKDGAWIFEDDAVHCKLPSFDTIDASPDGDDASRTALSVPQAGRVLVYDMHSGVFENATLTVTLNTDGTIQSVGTHDLSTAAAGFGTLAAAASAAASGEAAHNTAVGAVNTATLNQIQLPDNVNKALADCGTQAATAIKNGNTPVPCTSPK